MALRGMTEGVRFALIFGKAGEKNRMKRRKNRKKQEKNLRGNLDKPEKAYYD